MGRRGRTQPGPAERRQEDSAKQPRPGRLSSCSPNLVGSSPGCPGLPCDLRQTPPSGPQDPSLPEVEDPRDSTAASSLGPPPTVHPHPPLCNRARGGREAGRERAGRPAAVCAKTAPLDSLTQQKLAVPTQQLQSRGGGWRRLGCGWGAGLGRWQWGGRRGQGAPRGPHRREGRQAKGSGDSGLRGESVKGKTGDGSLLPVTWTLSRSPSSP